MRCFVAVDLSDEARDAIAEAQAALRTAGPRADVGWIDAAKFHLTLKFLGEVAEDARVGLEAALHDVAARHAPFRVAAGGMGGFPSRTRPRVLWAGLTDGLREIGRLAADVERACAALGFAMEAKPFRGHVTVGRVRSPRGLSRLLRALEGFASTAFGAWTVRDVVLYRSRLRGATGPLYEPLLRLPLGS